VAGSGQSDPVTESERRTVRTERPRAEGGHELPDARGGQRCGAAATDAQAVEIDERSLESVRLLRHEEGTLSGHDRQPDIPAGHPEASCLHG
jgi:hypothetical protein